MRIAFTKGQTLDRITVSRPGGAPLAFEFPKKGPTPHDAFHIFVERGLGMSRGFWGLVAAGRDPAEVGAMAAAGGHASAKRAGEPDAAIVELVQAERLVECFEAESWSGGADNEGLRHMAQAGWAASRVPERDLPDDRLDAIRAEIRAFAADWAQAAIGETRELEWRA